MNYLLESTVCITIFYGLYYLIFRRLTFIRLNRIYLLSSLIIGLSVPLISYQIKEVVKIPAAVEYEEVASMPLVMNNYTPLISNSPTEEIFDWKVVLQGIYVLGILFMLIKFSIIIYKILKISGISSKNNFISTKSNYANSSFFNLIFIDDSNLSASEINQILEHEKWHIRLFHSYDLMFVEILKIIFWFNPILWLYQRSLSEVHEYEVDTRMIQAYNPQTYAQLLLKLATAPQLATTHQFSRKPLTDRIHFLFTKQKSVPMKRLAYLSILPILVAFFMAFSVDKVVDYQEVEDSSKYFKIVKEEVKKREYKSISDLYLNKNDINLRIHPKLITVGAINEAAKYFKNYGFTLKILSKQINSSNNQLEKIEISLTEDNGDAKDKKRDKIKAIKENQIENYNFDLTEMRLKYKNPEETIYFVADKVSGGHTIIPGPFSFSAPSAIPPQEYFSIPKPPLAPKAPKAISSLPVPPKPPLAPKAPPKLGFLNNAFSDSIKLIGEGLLGKNPLVIIDGKIYPSSVLYKLNPDKIHGTALYKKNNPKPIIKELRENNNDGALVLETQKEEELFLTGKELEISIENENKRQDVKQIKSNVSRITLTNRKDGNKYDEVTVYRENGSKRASVNVQIGGKVLFLVKGEPKTEGELKKLNPKMLGNSVWASSGPNEYYIYKFPKIGKNTVATIAFNE